VALKLDKQKAISKAIDQQALVLAMLVLNGNEKKSKLHQIAYRIGTLIELRDRVCS
jgi:hypothetical protein